MLNVECRMTERRMCKGGHPHYCRQPNRLRSCGLKNVAELRLRTLKNLTSAIPQLSVVPCQFQYFLLPFPPLRMVLKFNQKYFLYYLFWWKLKIYLKETVAWEFWPPICFHDLTGFLIHTLNYFHMGLIHEKQQRPKISCYCPFKIFWIAKKTPDGKNIYNFKLLHGQNMPNFTEVKLSSCRVEIADFRKNCNCRVAVLEQQDL